MHPETHLQVRPSGSGQAISVSGSASTISSTSETSPADVTARNRHVFRRYEKSFKNIEDPSFRENGDKFAIWLSNERGYYEGARPEILKLLMIMHNTLRRAVGVAETQHVPFPPEAHNQHPMSEPYSNLVRTVHRHAHLFVEPNLQVLLKSLFFSVGLPYTPNIGSTGSTATTSPVKISNPAVVPPPHHVPNTVANTAAVPQQTTISSSVPQTQPHAYTQGHPSSISANGNATAAHTTLQNAFSNPSKSYIDKPNTAVQANIKDAPVAPSSQVQLKKRKRKTLDMATLQELDLKNYMQKRELAQPQIASPSSLGVAQLPLPAHSGETSTQGHLVTTALRPKMEEVPVSLSGTSSHYEVIEIFDTPPPPSRRVSPALAALALVKTEPCDDIIPMQASFKQTYTLDEDGVIDLTSDNEMENPTAPVGIDRAEHHVMAEDESMVVDESVPAELEPDLHAAPHIDVHPEPGPEPLQASAEASSPEGQIAHSAYDNLGGSANGDANMEVDSSDSQRLSSLSEQQSFSASLVPQPRPISIIEHAPPVIAHKVAYGGPPERQPEAPTDQPTYSGLANFGVNGEADMNIDSEQTPSFDQKSPPSAAPVPRPMPISVVGQTSVEALSKNKGDGGAPTDSEDKASEQENQTPMKAVCSPINDERTYEGNARVVTFQRGLTYESRLHFTFDLSEALYNSVVTWSKQEASISELKYSLCISLGCYPLSQLMISESIAPQLTSLSSMWPGEGGLSMKIGYKSNIEHFSLTPPILVSPDSTVDLSMFVQPGHNEFDLIQHRSWSEHVFILLAHHPTPGQMRKVEERRKRDEDWKSWLKQMAMPIHVPDPPCKVNGVRTNVDAI